MKNIKILLKSSSVKVAFIILLSVLSVKSQPMLTKALDYNGDGKADFVVINPQAHIWRASTNTLQELINISFGLSGKDSPVPGDYDGDGKGDIAVWRESEGVFYYLQSSNGAFVSRQWGIPGDEPVARDYDGDGKTDCAVVRRAGSALHWFVLESSTNAFKGYNFGLATDSPALGDYDGDGHFDLAVQRRDTANMVFYITKSSTGELVTKQLGFSTDFFAPGDYDGDGKTDIAVVRGIYGNEVEYEWYIMNSFDNSIRSLAYGKYDKRDFITPADYDGDGKTDISVWRVSDSTFYVDKSTGGPAQQQLGNVGSFPVASYNTH